MNKNGILDTLIRGRDKRDKERMGHVADILAEFKKLPAFKNEPIPESKIENITRVKS
jgi:hypothetical protein